MKNKVVRNHTNFSPSLLNKIVQFITAETPKLKYKIKITNNKGNITNGVVWNIKSPLPLCFIDLQTEDEPVVFFRNKKRYWVSGRTEKLVFILAHELRHCWQLPVLLRHKNDFEGMGTIYDPGYIRNIMEKDATDFAIKKIRAWRRFEDSISW